MQQQSSMQLADAKAAHQALAGRVMTCIPWPAIAAADGASGPLALVAGVPGNEDAAGTSPGPPLAAEPPQAVLDVVTTQLTHLAALVRGPLFPVSLGFAFARTNRGHTPLAFIRLGDPRRLWRRGKHCSV